MKRLTRRLLPVLSAFVMMLFLPACKGTDPVGVQLAGALNQGFSAIRADAELGIRARSDPEIAAKLGVALSSPDAARFATETLAYHQAIIDAVRDRAAGTYDPSKPLPAGPTTAPPATK